MVMAEPPKKTERRDAHAADNDANAEPTTGVYLATRDFVREVNKLGPVEGRARGRLVRARVLRHRRDGVEGDGAASEGRRSRSCRRRTAPGGRRRTTRLNRMSSEFTEHVQTEAERSARMEKKINAILDRLDVKDPAPTPPAPKDGGR
jgi:hypothetical protein